MWLDTSKTANINYLAKIVTLDQFRPAVGADKIEIANVDNYDVVVGKDSYKKGDVVVFFPIGSQISNFILYNLNLYADSQHNKDTEVKGKFSNNGLVKNIKVRGNSSMGFIIKLSDLLNIYHINPEDINNDFKSFDSVFNKLTSSYEIICKKYQILQIKNKPAKPRKEKTEGSKGFRRIIDEEFSFHPSTGKVRDNIKTMPVGNYRVTAKLHGTSFIMGRMKTFKRIPFTKTEQFINKIKSWFGFEQPVKKEVVYDDVYSSRNNIRNEFENQNYSHEEGIESNNIYTIAYHDLKHLLYDGLTLYGELVGYYPNGKAIQKACDKDYNYGCKKPREGEIFRLGVHYKFFIYKIKDDAFETTFGERATVNFDKLKYLNPFIVPEMSPDEFYLSNTNREEFLNYLKSFMNISCPMCKNGLPAEGVVVYNCDIPRYIPYKMVCQMFTDNEIVNLEKDIIDAESEN